MRTYKSIDKYLIDLRKALGNADGALVLDAKFDAEEHLSIMVEELMDSGKYKDLVKAIEVACEKYGAPEEVGKEYLRLYEIDKIWESNRLDCIDENRKR